MSKLNNGKSGAIFIGFLILLLVFQTIIIFTVSDENAQMWVFAFGSQLIFALSVLAGFFYYKIDFLEVSGIKRKISVKQLLFAALTGVICLVAFLPLAYLFLKLLDILGYNYTPQYGDYTSSAGLFLLGILGLAVCPALGEELMFRVNMVGGFKGVNRGFAIFMSALFFALMHGNASQLVHQFLIGVVMAYVFIITRSMWAPVMMHFTNNILALGISYAEERYDTSALDAFLNANTPKSALTLAGAAIIGSIVLIIVLWLFTKHLIKCKEKEEGLPYENVTREVFDHYRKKGATKVGVLGSVKASLMYLDRDNGVPIILGEKERINGSFFGALGLIALIWLSNLFLV